MAAHPGGHPFPRHMHLRSLRGRSHRPVTTQPHTNRHGTVRMHALLHARSLALDPTRPAICACAPTHRRTRHRDGPCGGHTCAHACIACICRCAGKHLWVPWIIAWPSMSAALLAMPSTAHAQTPTRTPSTLYRRHGTARSNHMHSGPCTRLRGQPLQWAAAPHLTIGLPLARITDSVSARAP